MKAVFVRPLTTTETRAEWWDSCHAVELRASDKGQPVKNFTHMAHVLKETDKRMERHVATLSQLSREAKLLVIHSMCELQRMERERQLEQERQQERLRQERQLAAAAARAQLQQQQQQQQQQQALALLLEQQIRRKAIQQQAQALQQQRARGQIHSATAAVEALIHQQQPFPPPSQPLLVPQQPTPLVPLHEPQRQVSSVVEIDDVD